MKKSIYDKLEDIPQADRDENNYQMCSDAGSPNNGKWVLLLDGAHPVQAKNTELLSEKAGTMKKTEHDSIVGQKDGQIAQLTNDLATAKTTSGIPAGQVAVPAEDATLLSQVKQLGDFATIKTKVDEYAVLKERDDANTRKTLLTDAANAHGLNPDAFVSLAELHKIAEKLEMREVPDPKKPAEKVKHFFVKGKDAVGADTAVVLSDYVKTDDNFKPFLPSLTTTDKSTVKVPKTGHGEPVKEGSPASNYINRTYGRREKAKQE